MSEQPLMFPFVDLRLRLQSDRLDRLAREDRRLQQAPSRESVIRETAGWLFRALEAGAGGGVAECYHLDTGWSAVCPETSAAVIPSLLALHKRLPESDALARAIRLAAPHGVLKRFWNPQAPTPVAAADVSTTARAILGWIALYDCTRDESCLRAAIAAAHRLMERRTGEASTCTMALSPQHQSLAAWALLSVDRRAADAGLRTVAAGCAEALAAALASDGHLQGYFRSDTLDPLLLRIAQYLHALTEAGMLAGEPRWIHAARHGAHCLHQAYRNNGAQDGRCGPGWRANHSFHCIAGCSQVALLWLRLAQQGDDDDFLSAAVRINQFVASAIDISNPDPGIRGGVRAGNPSWVDYYPLAYRAQAATLALDAFLLEEEVTGVGRSGHTLQFRKPATREGC